MDISFDINKIKFSVDEKTFARGLKLYESGAVSNFDDVGAFVTAYVQGTERYAVSVSKKSFKRAGCNCYVGQRDNICKHVVALGLYAVYGGGKIAESEADVVEYAVCNSVVRELSDVEIAELKKSITDAVKYIMPYRGPSSTWFADQDSLDEGCRRMRALISKVPVSLKSADILVKLLIRLDKKILGGVDDSNGIVGGFMYEIIAVLKEFAKIKPDIVKAFKQLYKYKEQGSCFGFEDELLECIDAAI